MDTIFVVNADDFGLSPDINRGIRMAHSRGIVRSTSIMANMPGSAEITDVRSSHPELGLGLHVCLTEGEPVSDPGDVRSLVDADGQFWPRAELFRRLGAGAIDLDEVAREVEAQHHRLQQLGVRPDHWNSHQYVHFHPRLLRVLKSSLRQVPCMRTHRRAYVGRHGWLRDGELLAFYRRMPLRLAKDLYFRFESWRSRRNGFRLPDAQLTRVPFAASFELLVDHAATNAPGGVFEWICHPAIARRASDKEIMDRPSELALLTRPGLETELSQAGIRLGNFTQALLVDDHAAVGR